LKEYFAMSSWKLKTAQLGAGRGVADRQSIRRRSPAGTTPAALLDPGYVASGACGLGAKRSAAFKPMQVALATYPTAVQDDGAGPPLWEGLGDLSFAITTQEPLAQKYFDQGLRLTFAFNHAEAWRAFKKARELDPGCAMCFWGEAFVLGANINAPMADGAQQPAFVALTNAKARAAGASPRERALIDALATRYAEPGADTADLAEAYADAMAAVHARLPDDQDIAVLFADAIMNTSPWDYWEADGRTPKGRLGEAVAAIEGVLASNPDHPGAAHLYIQLTEASATPERR
jgi:hypothetical protein